MCSGLYYYYRRSNLVDNLFSLLSWSKLIPFLSEKYHLTLFFDTSCIFRYTEDVRAASDYMKIQKQSTQSHQGGKLQVRFQQQGSTRYAVVNVETHHHCQFCEE